MQCIHNGDPITCKVCNRKKDILIYKKEPMNKLPSKVDLADYIKYSTLLWDIK